MLERLAGGRIGWRRDRGAPQSPTVTAATITVLARGVPVASAAGHGEA